MPTAQPFTVSRVLDAPRVVVFQAHTDPAHLARWLGPPGATVLQASMDLRPGGLYHYGLRMPDGGEMWGKQAFREVVVPERLVFVQSFSDAHGGLSRHPMAPTWPAHMLATTTLEALAGGATRVTVSWAPDGATDEEHATFDAARAGMEAGFAGTFAKLDAYLAATAREITSSRVVHASRERVWRALTDPAEVNAWWGPDGYRNVDVEQDVRVGGVWRFTMIGPDGTRHPNRCVYREIVRPERVAYDHGDEERVRFEATVSLDDEDGRTRVRLSLAFPSREERDAVVAFGAVELGWQSLAKLDRFVTGA